MTERSPFTEAQIETLQETTRLTTESGLATRYAAELKTLAELTGKLPMNFTPGLAAAAEAELPIAFRTRRHVAGKSIWIIKVNPADGSKLPDSELLVADYAYPDGPEASRLAGDFTKEDAQLAFGRFAAQLTVGLNLVG